MWKNALFMMSRLVTIAFVKNVGSGGPLRII
jgi:hypothetical protein